MERHTFEYIKKLDAPLNSTDSQMTLERKITPCQYPEMVKRMDSLMNEAQVHGSFLSNTRKLLVNRF